MARWLSRDLPGWGGAGLAWLASSILVAAALRSGARTRVPLGPILSRIPGALFFFVLLVLHGRSCPALFAYALAFAPPYLALVNWTGATRAINIGLVRSR